ncbi:3-hydroxyacyl-CoA dehydrogenase NAD-binding domain-containing protein [Granulicoccus phenolivorans]|uniref:3-hydroxyacyl-CoA dehydrogenase NAD-binding domain-containing protein n=1 Tax=Granulicoccus phenolivorans TaxID=266854 RepID=UPI002480775C|nr:3-hydroxyacyl-CoA dehydrogenase NAD-binding domain-containing protein [Granulicoccus phenolivorans]
MQTRGSISVIEVDSPPVNALSRDVRAGVSSAVVAANEDPDVVALVITCAGRTWMAGADIKEFGGPPLEPTFTRMIGVLDGSVKPIVAAVHGTALGGGLELALACHHRVAATGTVLGSPEIKLGLLPGAGGTQRLPRLIGPVAALDLILTARNVAADEALALGLVDAVVPSDELRRAAIATALEVAASGQPVRRVRDLSERIAPDAVPADLFTEARMNLSRSTPDLLAPQYCIRCVEAAVTMPFDDGVALERELFYELVDTSQSRALRHVFAAERRVKRPPGESASARDVQAVGVVGAGTMGSGIAMALADAGYRVHLVDSDRGALERSDTSAAARYQRMVGRGELSEAAARARRDSIGRSEELVSLRACDVVIEAVVERSDVKKALLRQVDEVLGADAIIASNTSTLDLDDLASVIGDPSRVIGLHFFSPAHIMTLVEVVRGRHTSPDALATALDMCRRMNKTGVVVGVCPGFVGNRMLLRRTAAADALLLQGAMPWEIDAALVSFGFKMGPYQMSDLIGLDVLWNRETTSSATIREVLCEQGRFGQKAGAGFYDYAESRRGAPSEQVADIVRGFARRSGQTQRAFGPDEIVDRLMAALVNEGAKLLDEGIATRGSDIDVVWVHGYGFPRHRGGPMFFADERGLDRMLASVEELGIPEQEPAPLLTRLVSEGGRLATYEPGVPSSG